jgi:hypothetical protein
VAQSGEDDDDRRHDGDRKRVFDGDRNQPTNDGRRPRPVDVLIRLDLEIPPRLD